MRCIRNVVLSVLAVLQMHQPTPPLHGAAASSSMHRQSLYWDVIVDKGCYTKIPVT